MRLLFRQLSALFAAIVVIAVQAHGVISTQHRLEHAAQFPAVAFADLGLHDHDHDGAAVEVADDDHASPEVAPPADRTGDQPIHHHHSGGDVQLGVLPRTALVDGVTSATGMLAPGLDQPRPDALLEDPSDPPRPTRLIA